MVLPSYGRVDVTSENKITWSIITEYYRNTEAAHTVSRFFHRPSNSLRHHTVSLLPEVEGIIQTSVTHFIERVTRRIGDPANFSIGANMITLGRLVFTVTDQRKGRKPDPDAVEWLMDIVDGKRHITDQDIRDYTDFLSFVAESYLKRHSNKAQNLTPLPT